MKLKCTLPHKLFVCLYWRAKTSASRIAPSPRFLHCCDESSRTLTDGYRPTERFLPAENIPLAPSEIRKDPHRVRTVHFGDFDFVSAAIGYKCH